VCERFDVGKPEAAEIRKAHRALLRDVAERVAADVTVIGGIRHFTYADAIENDPDYPSECHSVDLQCFLDPVRQHRHKTIRQESVHAAVDAALLIDYQSGRN